MRNIANALTLTAALLAIGCGSDDGGFNFVPNPPPAAVADSFATLGNSFLTGSVTANDSLNGATVTAFQNPSNSGGTVAVSSAGALTYTPPANVANVNDTFTYTLTNSAGSSTATVTVQIGARGFFVKNDVAVSGTGSQANPFKTLAEAAAAANGINGAQIVVFRGDGTSTGLNTPITLGTNQGLSSVDPANPATLTGPVILGSGNAVRNLRLFNSPSVAVNGNAGSNGSLTGLAVANTTDASVTLNSATGTFTIQNCTVANSLGEGCTANCTTGILNWTVNQCTFTNNTFSDTLVNVTGTASQNVTLQNSVVNQSKNALLVVLGNVGTIGVTATNNTVNGGGVTQRGLAIQTTGTAQLTGHFVGNTVSAVRSSGVTLLAGGTSQVKIRWETNQFTGPQSALLTTTGSTGASLLAQVFRNNSAPLFGIDQVNPGVAQVEQLSEFQTTNVGTLSVTGNVQDVPAGSLGIP